MLFVSKIKDLRLIRRPSDRTMDEQRRPIVLRGERVEFTNWRFNTEDPDLIEWLTAHRLYGSEFTSDKRDDKGVAPKPKNYFFDTDDEANALAKLSDNLPKNLQNPAKKFQKIQAINKRFDAMKKKSQADSNSMARGSMATAWGIPGPAPVPMDANPETEAPVRSGLTEDRVAEMISKAVGSAIGQVIELMKAAPAATVTKPTRSFHCKECGEEFKSGIEVGKHKVAVHAPKTESISEVK